MLKTLLSLFPNLATVSGSHLKFYDDSLHEANEYNHSVMMEDNEDLNTTLIFVSAFFLSTQPC